MGRRVALVTGFDPYGGGSVNPSTLVARSLDGAEVAGVPVVGRTLPVTLRGLPGRVEALLREVAPAAVVSLGLWPGDPTIRLERLAVNVADFEIPDNEGAVHEDLPLAPGSATAIPTRLPIRAALGALLDAGIPARLSNSAGTFLCNATMYEFLRATEARPIPCGFLHLPYLPEQVAALLRRTREERRVESHQRADVASMHVATMVEGVRIVLATALSGTGGAAA